MLTQIGIEAKKAAAQVAVLSTDKKNQILQSMADELVKNSKKILDANKVDLDNSKDLGLTPALIDRLTLSEERINGMANGLLKIIPLEDPVGNITNNWTTDEGLNIKKIRSPFGVIGVIYEARPNVTSDVSGLCLKSGNAVILRGSSYCLDSNIAILEVLQEALISNNCNKNIFQIIESKDRQDTLEFMNLTEFVDLIVPRGGKGLIQTLVDNSKVPFILDGDGNVHLYIHEDAKKENIIGGIGGGFKTILKGMNAERVLIASECIGDGRYFIDKATEYASEREVFGRPIGQNQGIQFPIAQAYCELEAAALMVDLAAEKFDRGDDIGAEANISKHLAAEASFKCGYECIQTFGGFGFARKYDIERKFRETRLYRVAPISTNLVLSFVGEKILKMPRSY